MGILLPFPKRDQGPQFSAHVYCLLAPNGCNDQDVTWFGGRPQSRPLCARWDPQKRGRARASPIFSPCLLWPNGWMDQDATWYKGRPQPGPHCVTWGPSCPPPKKKGAASPNFGPCLLWPNGRLSQLLLSTCTNGCPKIVLQQFEEQNVTQLTPGKWSG